MNCHIRTVHEGIRYQCDFCAKSFTQKPHLKSHLNEAHNQGKYWDLLIDLENSFEIYKEIKRKFNFLLIALSL